MTQPNGDIEDGVFARDEKFGSYLRSGTLTKPGVFVLEGEFTFNDDGKLFLKKGKRTYEEGDVEDGEFAI